MKTEKNWARLLVFVTGLVNQELLLQNEYLAAENRILGRKALARVACVAKPDTILAWYRKLVAQKFDGSKHRSYPGRPRISPELNR
jgi:putative transposase